MYIIVRNYLLVDVALIDVLREQIVKNHVCLICFCLFRYILSMAFNCILLVCSVNSDASFTICSSFFLNVYEFSLLISLVRLHRKRIVSSQLLVLNRKSIHFYDEKLFIRRIIARILKLQSKKKKSLLVCDIIR